VYRAAAVAAFAFALAVWAPGCKSCRKRAPALDAAKRARLLSEAPGITAIPKDARLVLSADVSTLAESVLVQRMVRQMLLRDPGLRGEFRKLSETCEFDIEKDLKHVVIGMAGDRVIAVATGRFIQSDIASCLNRDARQSGSTFEAKSAGGKSYWYVDKRGYERWMAVPVSKTFVLSTSEDWLRDSLAGNASVLDSAKMASLIARVHHTSDVWGASWVPASISGNLAKVTGGQVKHPPKALRFTLDILTGLKFRLDAQMKSPADAKAVASYVKRTLGLAKSLNLGKLAANVTTRVDGKAVTIQLSLTMEELKEILSLVDIKPSRQQDRPASAPRN